MARTFCAAGVKADEASDLAVVWIKAGRPLHAATLGDSDKLQIGDWVLAIGYAFDLDMTVSAGIIGGKACAASALAASDCGAELLQTNAMIGARALGGPLVDLDGKVVGIVAPCVASSCRLSGRRFRHSRQPGEVGRQATCRKGVGPTSVSRSAGRRNPRPSG